MLALNLPQRVAHRHQKITIGREHLAVQVELDHRLPAIHRGHPGFELGVLQPGGRHIGGKLDDGRGLAVSAEDRVIAGLNPHLAAILAEAFEFA